MNRRNPDQQPAAKLKKLIASAGFGSIRLNERTRGMIFPGRTREWLVAATLAGEWLNLAVTFCLVPSEPGLSASLLKHAMERNRWLSLLKFGMLQNTFVLEADYRIEHVDATILGKLVGHLVTGAEEQYPAVFRIVSGDATLESLENALLEGSGGR